MAVYGYARVSTDMQDCDRQVRDILEYAKKTGQEAPCIVTETASGAKDRPELMALLQRLGKDDTLLVCEFSRLTRRGIPELLEIARNITSKGAALVEIRSTTRYDNSAMGELLIAFTATVDRMERERIGERTKSALKARKAAGVKLGRPSTSRLDAQVPEIRKYLVMGIDKSTIAKLIHCSRGALINHMAKHPDKYKDCQIGGINK